MYLSNGIPTSAVAPAWLPISWGQVFEPTSMLGYSCDAMSEARELGIGPGTIIDDAFEIEHLIGRGGASTVWAARRVRHPAGEVAIKVVNFDSRLLRDAYARLTREAEILSQLRHPNIVQIHDYGVLADGRPYLVLERLAGESLQERLKRGRLPLDLALEIAVDVAAALSAAHDRGVVHLDVKPSNIFLCPTTALSSTQYWVKVIDFGIAGVIGDETQPSPSLTGTPQYMAPEQLSGGAQTVDQRADLFAIGAVTYEMLTGRPPFSGATVYEVSQQVVHGVPESVRQLAPYVPLAVATAIEGALEKNPANRPQTMTQFAAMLTKAPKGSAPSRAEAKEESTTPRTRLVMRVGIALLIVVAIAWSVGRDRPFLRASAGDTRVDMSAVVKPNTVAVMEFENQRPHDPANDWFRRGLQTAFNTELSNIRQLSVVAPEIIRATAGDSEIDTMEAARRLGVQRFITGSFVVVGGEIRIDARIVETIEGLQVAAEKVEGSVEEFLQLQGQLALAVLQHMKVSVSEAERSGLTSSPRAGADRYRLLLEAEGMTSPREAPPQAPTPSPQSGRLLQSPSMLLARIGSLLIKTAQAQEISSDIEAGVQQLLEDYRVAYVQGDLEQLSNLHVDFPEVQRQAVAEYRKQIRDLVVDVSDVRIDAHGEDVIVSYTRQDSFIDEETGEPILLKVRLTKFLVHQPNGWKFAPEQ